MGGDKGIREGAKESLQKVMEQVEDRHVMRLFGKV